MHTTHRPHKTTQRIMNDKFFDFEKAKVQTLTLDTLERTHKENDIYGKPLRGIYHYALLQQLIDLCEQHHYDVEVYDLFAAQNRDRNTPGVVLLPQVEAIHGERAVEAHILRRVFANIRLTNFDDESNTTNLAVAFHQKGIQVGFGNMVKICHNQCMLCPTHYIATYNERGNGRSAAQVSIEEVIETVKSWLFNAEHRIVTERAKIERMKQIEVNAQQMFTLIGMLTAIRVKCDSRTFGELLAVLEIAELMAEEHYKHKLSDINFCKRLIADRALVFVGKQNIPSVATSADLFVNLKSERR